VVTGQFPRRALRLPTDWTDVHEGELRANWNRARAHEPLHQIDPLRDPDYFRRVRLNSETGTVEWPNGADFAPTFLREKGTATDGAASRIATPD